MELIRGSINIKPRHHGSVVTIGNYDGVHLGHQAVLRMLREQSDALGLPSTVVIFEPQPQEFFMAEKAPARLTRFREKVVALERYGADRVLVIPFNQRFRDLTAQQFIDDLLVDGLGARSVVVGDDFRFGKNRAGDFAMLRQAGEAAGFAVSSMPTVEQDGERVSSTRVRKALAAGDMEGAARLLGRSYTMSGRVAHGDKRGRTIGFPTANIYLHRKVSPLSGVYVVRMSGLPHDDSGDDQSGVRYGVANVGTRPTVCGTRALLETHLFDFDADIYGQHVDVAFLHHIRDERKFESFDALKQQILLDADVARAWISDYQNQHRERH